MPASSISAKTYLIIYVTLLCITCVSTLIAFFHLSGDEIVPALFFAFCKATLIASVFMHVLYEGKLVRLVIAGAAVWFVILISLTLNDYMTRGWLGVTGK